MTGSEFSIHQRRNNYFSFDLSCSQRDLHSYMKECIWLHYDRECIFNPTEEKQLLFIWPILLTEGSSFIYERMYMIALWQGVNFQSTREGTITFHLTSPADRGIFIHIWKNVYDCIMTGSEFSIHQRRNIYFHLTSPAHRVIFIHIWKSRYDCIMTGSEFPKFIFNPPERFCIQEKWYRTFMVTVIVHHLSYATVTKQLPTVTPMWAYRVTVTANS